MDETKSKHTPGPWESIIREDHDGIWAYIGPINNRTDDIAKIDACNKLRQANAALIAAAPEMLEALENIKKFNWTGTGPSGCDAHCINHPCGPCRFETSLNGYINKIVEKATRRSK